MHAVGSSAATVAVAARIAAGPRPRLSNVVRNLVREAKGGLRGEKLSVPRLAVAGTQEDAALLNPGVSVLAESAVQEEVALLTPVVFSFLPPPQAALVSAVLVVATGLVTVFSTKKFSSKERSFMEGEEVQGLGIEGPLGRAPSPVLLPSPTPLPPPLALRYPRTTVEELEEQQEGEEEKEEKHEEEGEREGEEEAPPRSTSLPLLLRSLCAPVRVVFPAFGTGSRRTSASEASASCATEARGPTVHMSD